MSKSGAKKPPGSAWVDEIESEIESLRDIRSEMWRRRNELDFEGEAIWDSQERRWHRLEGKLRKLDARTTDSVHPGLATNIENLIAALEEAYEELDGLLD
jgi:hypothetical protein